MLEKLKAALPLNWTLLLNPTNWIVITLMVLIGGLAIALIFHPANDQPEGK